jgi:hypothetical protein
MRFVRNVQLDVLFLLTLLEPKPSPLTVSALLILRGNQCPPLSPGLFRLRPHLVIAVVTVILVGFGSKLSFFRGPIAAADVGSARSVSMDASGMHHEIKSLPMETFHDMTFVFSSGGG